MASNQTQLNRSQTEQHRENELSASTIAEQLRNKRNKKIKRFAIAACASGCVGFFTLFGIAAMVLGGMALRLAKKNGTKQITKITSSMFGSS